MPGPDIDAHELLDELKASAGIAAALSAAMKDERAETPEAALAVDAERAAVLSTLPDALSVLRSLWGSRAARGNNLASVLSQSAAAGTGAVHGWTDVSDAAMIAQGRSSALMARVVVSAVLPDYGISAAEGARRILDVGTGIGAIATVLAESVPGAEVVGIDIAERPLRIATGLLADVDPGVADRITYRREDVTDLSETDAYDVVWMPVPFLPDDIIDAAMKRVAHALRPGGLLILGTLPGSPNPRLRAVDAWLGSLTRGSTLTTDDAAERLRRHGLVDVRRYETVPGGPVLLAAVVDR